MAHEMRFSQFQKSYGSPEPMMMSPSSPSPASHSSNQYLPGFLLGDHTPVAPPPVQSPGRGYWSTGAASGNAPSHRYGSHSQAHSSPAPHIFNSSSRFLDRLDENELASSRSKDKMAAPPLAGLLDTSMNVASPARHSVSLQHSLMDNLEPKHSLTAGYSSPLPVQHNMSLSNTSYSSPALGGSTSLHQVLNNSHIPTPISPPQVDPFYTQGEELSHNDVLDDHWITVFGFAAGAADYVLERFGEYGVIVNSVICNDGNWMHLHYKSLIGAKKALSKNGKVIGNNMMVGVRQCIDKAVMNGKRDLETMTCPDNDISLHSVNHKVLTKTVGSFYEPSSTGVGSKPGTPLRPLTKAYQSADKNAAPSGAKDEVWWKKAMEYAFGW